MSSDDKNVSRKDKQIAFLADRLAIAILLLRRDIDLALVMLPSREDDREILRDDPDYEKMTNNVREMLRSVQR